MAKGLDASMSENPTSIVFDYCNDVYKSMMERAEVEYENDEDKQGDLVYTGFFTKLVIDDLKLAVPYYTKIKNELVRMGCIRQLRRGGSTSPSKWLLIKEPDEQLFREGNELKTPGKTKWDSLQQQIRDLTGRLNTLEDTVAEILPTGGTDVQ